MESFCDWLEGVLDTIPEGAGVNQDLTNKIKAKLNDVFEHVIDPTFPADKQEALNTAHQPVRRPPTGGSSLIKC